MNSKLILISILSLFTASVHADPDIPQSNHFSAANGTPSADVTPFVIATAIAGTRRYVGSWSVVNSDASVGTLVDLMSGSTVIDTCSAGAVYASPCVKTYPKDAFLRSGSNEALSCKARTTSAEVICAVAGYLYTH